MLLDNVFPFLGEAGTAVLLVSILVLVGAPALSQLFCPWSPLRRLQPRGR